MRSNENGSMKTGLPLIVTLMIGVLCLAGTLLPGAAEATVAITTCGDCHGNPPTDSATRSDVTGSFPGSHSRHAVSMNLTCDVCHVSPNWTSFSHQNGNIQTRVPLWGQWGTYSKGASFAQNNTVSMGTCNGLYCHSTVQADGGSMTGVTYGSPRWGSSGTVPCGSCHAVPNTTGKHSKHEAWASSAMRIWTTNSCQMCHAGAGDETVLHARGTINIAIGTTYYGLTTASYSQGNHAPGNNYGTCSAAYCHGGWTSASGAAMTPSWTTSGAAAIACGDCHAATAATPPPSGSHRRHAGNWSTAVGMACTSCHGSTAGSSTHADLSVQWAFNQADARLSTIARYKGSIQGTTGAKARATTVFGNCSNIYCHSNVQAEGGLAGPTTWATPNWGTASTGACGTCHLFPAASGGHTPHLKVYGTNQAACQTCHNGAGDGTVYHARGTINMRINTSYWGITTALYSQGEHKGAGGGYGSCSATLCHGGTTKVWNSINSGNHQCTKCHGNAWSTTTYSLYKAAPGADGTGVDLSGTAGTVNNGVSTDPQVGAHNTHLLGLNTISSAMPCTSCHTVPTVPNSAGHNNTGNPVELVWSALATSNGLTPAWSTTNRTCSTTYCHGGGMPRGDTSGSNRVPSWTTGGYIVNPANANNGCSKCHGAPPTTGASVGSHGGITTIVGTCTTCHTHVAANGSFTNPALHIDGVLQAPSGGCTACHSYDTTGGGATWGAGSVGAGLSVTTVAWGAHAKHIEHLKLRTGTTLSAATNTFGGTAYNAVCGVCHTQNKLVDHGPDGGVTARAINFNGSAAHVFGSQPTPSFGIGTRSCNSLDCHFKASPQW